ncbi:rod shape-determining protein MreD [uncultured Clostridium sp.]|uniref:rod shape-determining protein MreD n=1 Tax=uncultured Clostridium sp. TaxID=59620 RepID=UPI0028E9F008|nr:rod shape-determining protein MreD [uncultured Clostridium sp.]
MRKILTLFSIVLILFIGDNSIIPFLAVKGFSPSLLFVFIVSYSIINESWEGLWLGVFAGLLQDVYFSNVLGINALVNMLSCAIAGYVGISIFKEKLLIPVATSFLLSIFKGILVFVLLYTVNVNMPLRNILFNSLYNMLVSIIMYKFVFKLCSKDYMKKKWKF